MANELQQYLSDHWSGSQAGLQLAVKAARDHAHEPSVAAFLNQLIADLHDDRRILRAVMSSCDSAPNLKTLAASFGQRVGSAVEQLSTLFARSRDVNRVLELELLMAASTGRLSLWRTLDRLSVRDPRLQGFDFAKLIHRTEHHIAELQRRQLGQAGPVFAAGGAVPQLSTQEL